MEECIRSFRHVKVVDKEYIKFKESIDGIIVDVRKLDIDLAFKKKIINKLHLARANKNWRYLEEARNHLLKAESIKSNQSSKSTNNDEVIF